MERGDALRREIAIKRDAAFKAALKVKHRRSRKTKSTRSVAL
jgi:hypothetical protein